MKPNIGIFDRWIRLIVGLSLFVLGYFWMNGLWAILVILIGFIGIGTGLIGYCSLYTTLGCKNRKTRLVCPRWLKWVFLVSVPVILFIEVTVSVRMTMNIFLEDFQQVNIAYKRVLFATSTDQKEESQKKYEQFEKAHSEFMQKYFFYRPYAIKNDALFNSDLQKVQSIIEEAQNLFVTSSLPDAYKKLEEIRPIWQAFFKRNNLSILTAALIDFQDVMDDMIDAANEGNTGAILTEYTPAHERLQIIEQELTGTDVQQVRKSLDKLYTEAKNQKLETLETTAQELHDNFVIINLRADEK